VSGRAHRRRSPFFATGLAGAGRVLVGADDGAVDEMQVPVDPALAIGTSLKRLQDILPVPALRQR